MTGRERALWIRAQRRAAGLSPDVSRSILKALETLRANLSDREIVALIERGYFDQIIDDAKLSKAFDPVSETLQNAVSRAAKQFAKDLPRDIGTAFNVLNPDIIDAIRALDTKVIKSLTDDIKETVRAYVENGLRDGVAPKEIAREIRSLIGLGPSQLEQVQNYRDALNGENGRQISDYTLRDKRFKGALTPEKVDRMVEVYKERRIAQNAETIAKTASLDAMKAGQKISIDKAVDMGIYNPDTLMKSWKGVLDDREREEHLDMEGETVPYDAPYSNGEDTPGEGTWNCRCLSIFHAA